MTFQSSIGLFSQKMEPKKRRQSNRVGQAKNSVKLASRFSVRADDRLLMLLSSTQKMCFEKV